VTAFFAAEPEEAGAIREALGAGVLLEAPFPLYRGEGVLVAETGVGKVAAAMAVAHVLTRFAPKESFFLGVAGALDPGLRALDLLLAERAVQWDVDLTPFGRAPGETALGVRFFPSDPHLLERAEGAALALGLPRGGGWWLRGTGFWRTGRRRKGFAPSTGPTPWRWKGRLPSWWPTGSATPWPWCGR